MNKKILELIYDKQCPMCDNYCQLVRIKKSIGELNLIDARSNNKVMQEITLAGLDIDKGMVLKMNNQLYYGSDAIHTLALISSRIGVFNRINYWLFRTKLLSNICYPIFRTMRNIILKLLSKTKINNLKTKNNSHF